MRNLLFLKNQINFIELDIFTEEIIAINILTTRGTITIATAYQPSRRPYLLREDFSKLFRRQNPVLLLGDLNARCRESRYTLDFNQQGRNLSIFIEEGLCQRLRPDFKTFITNRVPTKPDIVLANHSGLQNYWIRKGQPTFSDYQTIRMDISWSPIQIPAKPRKQYSKTNWQQYQEKLHHLAEIELSDDKNTQFIEKNIWNYSGSNTACCWQNMYSNFNPQDSITSNLHKYRIPPYPTNRDII